MGIRSFLDKMRGIFGGLPNANGEKLSPDEMELRVYLERERKKKIKKLVHQYRKAETRDFLQGNKETQLLSQPPSLVTTPSRSGELSQKQKKKLKDHDKLLNQKSLFMR